MRSETQRELTNERVLVVYGQLSIVNFRVYRLVLQDPDQPPRPTSAMDLELDWIRGWRDVLN